MRDPRRYYEAHVLVVPIGSSSAAMVAELRDAGLAGVGVLERARSENGQPAAYRVGSVGEGSAGQRAVLMDLDAALDAADMVVFVGADLREIDRELVEAVEQGSRAAGDLLAAVTIEPARATEASDDGRALLREHVDMFVTVRAAPLAAAFLDVVRGGRRDPAGTESTDRQDSS